MGALCGMVFDGWRARLHKNDFVVGFALGDAGSWVVDGSGRRVVVAKRSVEAAGAVVRMSPPDFLRLMVRDLDVAAAAGDGRMVVEGDASQVQRLFDAPD